MEITREMVDHVAALSRLSLSEEEKEQQGRDMGKILAYMDKLNELDTEGVEPMSHAFPIRNVFREDVFSPSESRAVLLSNAQKKSGGAFRVPRTVE